MRLHSDIFSECREQVDIEDAARRYGMVPGCGNRWLCCYHAEQNASVTFHNNYFRCWSCGESGDVIKLTQKLTGAARPIDAVRRLNDDFRLGLQIGGYKLPDWVKPPPEPAQDKPPPEPEADYTTYFQLCRSRIEQTDYWERRGLSAEVVREYWLGYDPAFRHPKVPNAPPSPRLIVPTSRHSFLARDTRSELTEVQAKYAKQKVGRTRIFNLKALDRAQTPIFVVEGEIDALTILSAGRQAVGLGSTSMVTELAKQLQEHRPTVPLILALDNDEPGQTATKKLAHELKKLKIPYLEVN